ncbi:MAG: DEAD/DEAH box helicase [Planctomycetota bacterium]
MPQETIKRFDPVAAAREITNSYLRYLKTSFCFKDPELRASFEAALEAGSLVRGPYLESTPVYKTHVTTRELLHELLGHEVEQALVTSLDPERRLYLHQEEALRRLWAERNVVVATGTGSGKTEAFLLPILLELYRETLHNERRPGVRALILYPMNALANDQRQRLGKLAQRLKENGSRFAFTFGRYTGDTPEDENDTKRHARQQVRLPGELVLRREMREEPPDILLTNYSMLEYLLLRPYDSPLFDDGNGETWRFVVLDEAHQYRGTKGMEMAMLLRRLKQRLREGGLETRLRCIATSASLGGREADRDGLARFAEALFGEGFTKDDVILETCIAARLPGSARIAPHAYGPIAQALLQGERERAERTIASLATELGVSLDGCTTIEGALHGLLAADARVAKLRRAIETAQPLDKVAARVFDELPEEQREQALAELVSLLVQTRDPSSGAPLLNARYHLFVRALEGAFLRYRPQQRIQLSHTGGATSAEGESGALFEVALCRECGQHFLVGRKDGAKLCEAVRDPGADDFGVSFFRPVEGSPGEPDERRSKLCLVCGALSPAGRNPAPPCEHDAFLDVIKEESSETNEDQLRKCGACGYQGRDPVREIVHGTDGPNVVIATSLHGTLPERLRKVLCFVDGRQEAAFFAWYLEESYGSLRERGIVLETPRRLGRGGAQAFSLRTLAISLRDALTEHGLIKPSADDVERLREAWRLAYRECLSDETRISLEGVGLLRWFPHLPEDLEVPPSLREPPWSLSREEARTLLAYLLDTLRADGAVELCADVGVTLAWGDLKLLRPQSLAKIGSGGKGRAWDGARTRRASFLRRVLRAAGGSSGDEREETRQIQQLLRETWEALKQAGGDDPLLVRVGDGHRANANWWRGQVLEREAALWVCDACGRQQAFSIRGVCCRHDCPGTVAPAPAEDPRLTGNHYRVLYEKDLPDKLRAEEHTAQIERDKAREFQEAFDKGEIHFLSCSTTFELGVDLGELDTIFLRNVPPEPFNYAQRVGRAGRRQGHIGFAVTFCRRRPHDLVHFNDPSSMLAGKTHPPVLRLTNEKIVLRHMAAVVLAAFFRERKERFERVERFAGDMEHPQAVSDVKSFMAEHHAALGATLRAIVPQALHGQVGLADGSWDAKIADPQSRLAMAEAEVCDDYRRIVEFKAWCVEKRRWADADWAEKRERTIRQDELLTFLSRKAVIPKYGFPVDVVELDLHRSGQGTKEAFEVSLQRDLAIAVSEFAPGSKVVANKKVWTSYGLKRIREREWPRRAYLRCSRHGTFDRSESGETGGATCCCDDAQESTYIDPIFGFTTERKKGSEDPQQRPARLFTTRPYFARSPGESTETIVMGGIADVYKAAPGNLVVLCEGKKGRGFWICKTCGAGWSSKPRNAEHTTPLGTECRGTVAAVALGHEFVTDVLRIKFLAGTGGATGDPLWLAYSVAYALLLGSSEILEVPQQDLSVTVFRGDARDTMPEIVLYDNVPGGAGLVASLEDPALFRKCLESACERVDGRCGCAPDISCYGCLRSYSNQFAHPRLERGRAHDYLESAIRAWASV